MDQTYSSVVKLCFAKSPLPITKRGNHKTGVSQIRISRTHPVFSWIKALKLACPARMVRFLKLRLSVKIAWSPKLLHGGGGGEYTRDCNKTCGYIPGISWCSICSLCDLPIRDHRTIDLLWPPRKERCTVEKEDRCLAINTPCARIIRVTLSLLGQTTAVCRWGRGRSHRRI